MAKKVMSDSELKKKLTAQQYHVLREKGTEQPFTGHLLHNKDDGDYKCTVCENVLFKSDSKYDSGTGWPSFEDIAKHGNVETKLDTSHMMIRTEVLCGKCKSHLGHMFSDGSSVTGKRYCINSCALDFKKKDVTKPKVKSKKKK